MYIYIFKCMYIYIYKYLHIYVYVFICRAMVVGMSECSCFHTTFGGKLPGALPAFVYRRFLKRPIRGFFLGGLSPLLQELLLRFAGQVLQGSSHLLLPILRNGRRSVENDPPSSKPQRGVCEQGYTGMPLSLKDFRQVHGPKKQ